MLKIPTFIIGGLLILTGLAGYLFQDQGLSVKLTGPLADDAEFTLSDGNDSISVDLGFPSSKSAGEYAFWIVHRLNLNHAKDRSQANYAVEQGSTAYETQSFWHASSKGNTQKALVLHAETGELGNLAETDANRSTVRIVYKNFTANTSPVTLTSTNWTNIESKTELKPGDSLQFSKSWTAFIPGIIGIILIALVQGAEMKPNANAKQNKLRRDIDDFDHHFDHILVFDNNIKGTVNEKVIGTYRLNRGKQYNEEKLFYTSNEYDINSLINYKGKILELGRSCVAKNYRTGSTMQLLW